MSGIDAGLDQRVELQVCRLTIGVGRDASIAYQHARKTGTKVASVIADAAIGVVNLSEVVSHFVRAGMPTRDVEDMLNALPFTLVPADASLAWEAGRLRADTAEAGLSLGDRFCLALAKREGLPAWTADNVWKTIAGASNVKVVLIR